MIRLNRNVWDENIVMGMFESSSKEFGYHLYRDATLSLTSVSSLNFGEKLFRLTTFTTDSNLVWGGNVPKF